jgi:hypothetical protein
VAVGEQQNPPLQEPVAQELLVVQEAPGKVELKDTDTPEPPPTDPLPPPIPPPPPPPAENAEGVIVAVTETVMEKVTEGEVV